MIFTFNSSIHFRTKRWLWAGLANGSPLLRVCRYSLSSEIRNGESEQDREITVRDRKSRSKQTKNQKKLSERKKVEGTSEKKISKRVLHSESTRSMSDVSLEEENQTINSKDSLNAIPPPLSFPFDGSNYTEIDDEFNMRHCASINESYAVDSLSVQRMDDYRSEGRFYRILSAGASVLFPSVTTVLSNTPTRPQYYRLHNWKKNMIKQHGEEQFENIQQQTKDAGTHFHQELEKKLFKLQLPDSISIKPHLSGNEKLPPHLHSMPSIGKKDTKTTPTEGSVRSLTDKPEAYEKQVSEYIKSVEHVLKQISCVLALESVVIHHELGYTGTCDCVAKYRDEVCLIDWKSSEKQKPTLDDCYDFPLQAVAYAGAINRDDHYPFKVFSALIVVAYADGAPAHAHFLSYKECQFYWSKWLHRLQEYQTQFASDHSNNIYNYY